MREPTVGWFCDVIGARSEANPQGPLYPVSIDSRTLHAGDVFWALRAQRDGHEFVPDAFARGARAAVVNTAWAATDAAQPFHNSLIVVDDPLAALTAAARSWRKTLRCRVIGITGSNGKTSTKNLLLLLLRGQCSAGGTQGNFNNEIGVPLTMLGVPADADVAVIEMGASKRGDIAFLCGVCAPTHGLVTSISAAHLQGFGDLQTVALTKGELYDYIAERGTAFVPLNNAYCVNAAAACRQRIGFGFDNALQTWTDEIRLGQNLGFNNDGCAQFDFAGTIVNVPVPGRAAAQTALAALTVAHALGVPPLNGARALARWESAAGRGRIIRLPHGTIIDDSYNANPASMRNALELLHMLPAPRRVAILGDMNELGDHAEAEHRALGADAAARNVHAFIFVGRFAEIAAASVQDRNRAFAFADWDALESRLESVVRAGDTVLVKGSRSLRLERAVEQLRRMFA